MTAQIFEFTATPADTPLSIQIQNCTILGKATTIAALVEAVENLHGSVPDADLLMAVWRQSAALPPGRVIQLIDELDWVFR